MSGALVSPDGLTFPIVEGLPDFTYPQTLSDADQRVRDFYDNRVDDYDRYLPLTFQTYGESEDAVREDMVARLRLKEDATVLEHRLRKRPEIANTSPAVSRAGGSSAKTSRSKCSAPSSGG